MGKTEFGFWEYGFYCEGAGQHTIERWDPFRQEMVYTPVIPETVREYTGLKDRNGKRIFEGDIVDIPGWGKGAVYFVDGRYGATGNKERNYPFYWLGYCKTDHSDFEAEVIGNVHDNPELLEGAKDDSE